MKRYIICSVIILTAGLSQTSILSNNAVQVVPGIRDDYVPTAVSDPEDRNESSSWCGTMPWFEERNGGTRSCSIYGDTDDPGVRDSFIPDGDTPVKTVRLYVHAFADDDGSDPTTTLADAEAQLLTLNDDFVDHKVQFEMVFEIHNDAQYQTIDGYGYDVREAYAVSPSEYHNVFVSVLDGLLGVSTFPWDSDALTVYGGTLVDKDWFGGPRLFDWQDDVPQKTLTHELGHALGLWHTHHGVDEVAECGSCYEGADGYDYSDDDNPDVVGDLCSDTKGTPTNYTCTDPSGTDCLGNPWTGTHVHNFMGYASDACYDLNNDGFSSQQSGRIHGWVTDRLEGLLVTVYGCTDPFAGNYDPDANTDDGSCTDYPNNENYSLSFDGVDDYVDLGTGFNLQDYTIEVRLKTNDTDEGVIISKLVGANQDASSWRIWQVNGVIKTGVDGDAPGIEGTDIADDNWHTVTAQNIGEENMYLHVDGIFLGGTDGYYNSTSTQVNIGAQMNGPYFFNQMVIDEIRISNISRYGASSFDDGQWQTDDNTIALYKFNAGEGAILYDHSGNQNHGTIYGATWSGDVPVYGCTDSYAGNYNSDATLDDGTCTDYPQNGNHSLDFGGDADYVGINASQDFDLSDEQTLTISGYIKTTGNNDVFFQAEQSFGYYVGYNSDGKFDMTMYFDGYTDLCASNTQINDGNWHYVTGTYDGSDMRIYVDGVLENTCAAGVLVSQDQASPITIGAYRPGASNYQTDGSVDELSVWGVALEQDQIQEMMYTDSTWQDDNLVAHYKFNANDGNVLFDHSGNSNHGTINGATWNGDVPPSPGENNSLSFDGVNDHVDIGDIGDFFPVTYELWFKPAQDIQGSIEQDQYLLSKDGNGLWTFRIAQLMDGRVGLGIGGTEVGGSWVHSTNTTWMADTWYHIAATVDHYENDELEMMIYVNGEMQDSYISSETIQANGYSTFAGTDVYASGGWFEGNIDGIGIWDVARTQEQIQANMSNELNGNEFGLVGYWNFNEGEGTTLTELSGNGNDGVINGASWSGDSAPVDPPVPFTGPDWYVSTDGSNDNDGSEGGPFSTIQFGIDAASDGDTVNVAAGTYTENVNFNGKNITVVSTDGPEATVIDGDQNGSVVTFSNGEDETALLTGFTIQNGSAQYGAGVVSQYSGPTLSDLIVQNNVTADNGSGGGVNFYNSTGRLLNSVVRENHSTGTGGGVFIAHGAVQVTNTLIVNNTCNYLGAGMRIHSADHEITNCTIAGNAADSTGGGIHVGGNGSSSIITSSIVWDNSPNQIEGGQDLIITYSSVQDGWGGEGNIDSDPIFCSDYSLFEDSPCVGTGLDGTNMGALGVGCYPTAVTFNFDLTNQDVSGSGVHIAASFQGWDPTSTEMTDPDEDGVYSYTTELVSGQWIEYKFINGDSWEDPLDNVEDPTCGAGGEWGNRLLVVPEADVELGAVCMNYCESCDVIFPPNYSLSFDGVDDYIQIGTSGSDNNGTDSDIGSLLGDGPFSVSFWYNTSENPNGDYEFIIDQRRADNWGDGWLIMNQNGKIAFDIQTGAGTETRVNSPTTIPTDVWNHITCTWDGTSGNVYFNGVLDASENIPSRRNNNVGMAIGTRFSHNEKYLKGNIDQIKVRDYPMAQDQIQNDMYSSLNGDEWGLIGYWNFNEGDGTTLTDQTSNGNDGIIYGPIWSEDVPIEPVYGCTDPFAGNYDPDANTDDGSCSDYPDNGNFSLDFDGEDDHVSVPYSNQLNSFEDVLSISTWIKVTGGEGNNRTILENGNVEGFALMLGSNEKFYATIQNQTGWTTVDGTTIVDLNTWYNVAVTHTSNSIKIYVNGEVDGETTGSFGDIINNDGELFIGRYHEYEHYFIGNIDEVSLWDIALTQEEIQESMFTDSTGYQPDMVAQWKFNANDGSTLFDHSGNQNHGTINGATWDGEGFTRPKTSVTLAVNMRDYIASEGDSLYDGVYIASVNSGADDPDTLDSQMYDDDGDGIYDVTLDLERNSHYIYRFRIGPVDENSDGNWEYVPYECGEGWPRNRYFDTGFGDTQVVGLFCFNECENCFSPNISSLSFDGVDDHVEMAPNSNLVAQNNSLTIEAWVKIPSSNTNAHATVFGARLGYGYILYAGSNDLSSPGAARLDINTSESTFEDLQGDTDLRDNQWHFIAATYDGNTAKLYVDGELENQMSFNTDYLSTLSGDNNTYIGRGNHDPEYFTGNLDEIAVWNIALTVEQIQDNMYTALSGYEEDLVGYWNFNEGDGTTLTDLSGNGNNGAISGATWSTNMPQPPHDGPEWYVSTEGSNDNNGSNYYPFSTIQHAIDSSDSSDFIFVGPGTYVENIDISGRSISITSVDGPGSTIIDGNQSGRVFTYDNPSSQEVVSHIEGFTVRNGSWTGSGAGLYVYFGEMHIQDMVFESNQTSDVGGGVMIQNSYSTMNNVVIKNNNAHQGAGLYLIDATVNVEGSEVTGNNSAHDGAGIYINSASLEIRSSVISHNTSENNGGAFLQSGNLTVSSCEIAYNSASDMGAAFAIINHDTTNIVNCTIAENSSGAVIMLEEESGDEAPPVVILNSIIWGNTSNDLYTVEGIVPVTMLYTDSENDMDGEGNFSADPLFVDPDGGDLHLLDHSPCVGAGLDSVYVDDVLFTVGSLDASGIRRPYPTDSNPDMGAYENYLGEPALPPFIDDVSVTVDGRTASFEVVTEQEHDHFHWFVDYGDTLMSTGSNSVSDLSRGPHYIMAFLVDEDHEPTSATFVKSFYVLDGLGLYLYEGFEDTTTWYGWSSYTNSAVGWFVSDDGTGDPEYWPIPPGSGMYATSNDDEANDDGSMDYMVMPEMDLTEHGETVLAFTSYYTAQWDQTAHIEVSTDGGSSWEEVLQLEGGTFNQWTPVFVDLSGYTDQESVHIAFHSNDNDKWASGWAVDNVMLMEHYYYDPEIASLNVSVSGFTASFDITANGDHDHFHWFVDYGDTVMSTNSTSASGLDLGLHNVTAFLVDQDHEQVSPDLVQSFYVIDDLELFFYEDFEDSSALTEWTMETNGNGWFISADGSFPEWQVPPGSGLYMTANDDGDVDASMDHLIMPEMDLASYGSPVALEFHSYYNGIGTSGDSESGRVKRQLSGLYDQSEYPDRSRQGGDTVDDPVVIDAVPYNTTGVTSGYTDDYDEVCGAGSSDSPDVVYSFTPDAEMIIDVGLCGEGTYYDTKIFVYESEAGNLASTISGDGACNDDACNNSHQNYISYIEGVVMREGVTYYIVVDGWNGSNGEYEIDLSETEIAPVHAASVEISTDGGSYWEPILSIEPVYNQWDRVYLDLSMFASDSSVLLMFHSNDNIVSGSGWAVDDVILTEAYRPNAVIMGTVVAAPDSLEVDGAHVIAVAEDSSFVADTYTDLFGVFSLDVIGDKWYYVNASYDGYQDQTEYVYVAPADSTTWVDIVLGSDSQNDAIVEGTVFDWYTGEPVPSASVLFAYTDGDLQIIEATADESGYFMEQVPAGFDHDLFVYAEGYFSEHDAFYLSPGDHEVLEIGIPSLSQAGRIYGTVTNSETGDAVSYAEASLNCGEDEDWDHTGALGTYRLFAYYPGECNDGILMVRADGYLTQYHSTSEMSFQAGATVNFNITLDEGTDPEPGMMHGTVFSSGTEDPLPGAEVSAYSYQTGDTYGTQADESGVYSFDLAGEQNYEVLVSAEGHNDLMEDHYLESNDSLNVDFYLDEEPRSSIYGTVTNSSGDSLSGVNIYTSSDGEWLPWTDTDESGYYSMILDPGVYDIVTGYNGYYVSSTPGIELGEDTDLQVDLVLEPIDEFDGGVAGMVYTSGEDVGSIFINVFNTTYDATTYADEDNSYSLELVNGTYDLWVSAPGYDILYVPDAFTVEDNTVTYDIYLYDPGTPHPPVITSLVDVPDDQGRQMDMGWSPGIPQDWGVFPFYSVWREIDGDQGWHYIGQVPYHDFDTYNMVVPTLGDSTDEGIHWSTFMVTAHTEDPYVFFDSETATGYSVDNLPPDTPVGLTATIVDDGVLLTWSSPLDEDFSYHNLYRNELSSEDPAMVFTTIDSFYLDTEIDEFTDYEYWVTAVDHSGNESDPSDVVSVSGTQLLSDKELIPDVFALQQNYPNPFNPTTQIRYALPEQSTVVLMIYDMLGREVRALVNDTQDAGYRIALWNGTNDHGRPVGAGMYIYTIRANDFYEVKKMILLK